MLQRVMTPTLLLINRFFLVLIANLEVRDRVAKIPSRYSVPNALTLCRCSCALRAKIHRVRYFQYTLIDGRYGANLRIRASFDREPGCVGLRERILCAPCELVAYLSRDGELGFSDERDSGYKIFVMSAKHTRKAS